MDISVIIPTYNRVERLKNCLNSLFNQSYKGKYEVIVVDDGSTDNTLSLLKKLIKNNKKLKFYKQRNKGPASARNLGVRKSKGMIIAFTDDDCVVDKNWVKLMVEEHKRYPKKVAVGGETIVDKKNIFSVVSQYLSNITMIDNRSLIFFPTCNVSLNRDIFQKIGFFDEGFPLAAGEDLEFFWRVYKNGYKLFHNPNIKVTHNINLNLRKFIKQSYNYGKGNYHAKLLCKDHPKLFNLYTGNVFSFLKQLVNDLLLIPHFSINNAEKIKNIMKTNNKIITISLVFVIHRFFYLVGVVSERIST